VSPYESDAQIAFLLKHGYADFAVMEDSDLLVYGCEKVSISGFTYAVCELDRWVICIFSF
jgi:5'-3' exonuclease